MSYPKKYYLGDLKPADYSIGLENTIGKILDMKTNEKLFIVTTIVSPEDWDKIDQVEQRCRRETYTIAKFLQFQAREMGINNVEFVEYSAALRKAEPPSDIAEKILSNTSEDTVMILMPWDSLTHTQFRKQANELGARIMSSPHFTAEMMKNGGPMCADYSEVKKISEALAEILNKAKYSTITAPNGTELQVFYEDSPSHPDTGVLTEPGSMSNLPAGEAYRALRPEGGGLFAGILEGEEVRLKIENGYVIDILSDNRVSRKVRSALFPEVETEETIKMRQLAEDGTGTNKMLAANPMKWTHSPLTLEKIYGTKHLAPGDNSTFGGKNVASYHTDFVVFEPTWTLDNGLVILEQGVFNESIL